jgi:imidazolonepropionase-like amidohydrolase
MERRMTFAFLRRTLAAAAGLAVLGPAQAAAQPRPTQPTQPPAFAITNARVVIAPGRTLERATVLVNRGVIREVGADVDVPAGAWTVDGTGLTVYPGLIDAMTTLGQETAPAGQGGGGFGGAGGFGQDVDPDQYSWGPEDRPGTFTWLSAADELDASDERFERWRNAGFTTALAAPASGFVTGDGAMLNLAGGRAREMVVANRVATRVNLQARGFPGYPGSLMGSFAYLKQLYMDGRHYDDVWTAYEEDPVGKVRPEWDRALDPIRDALRQQRPVLFPASGAVEIRRALQTAEVMDLPVIVYGAQGAWDAAELLGEAGTPAIVDLDWPAAPADGEDQDPDLRTLRTREYAPTTPAALARAGVRFAFTADGLRNPDEARAKIRVAIERGLSPDDALRALTVWPAEIFGVQDRLGTIETGKIANLVVADGDLFTAGTRLEWVVVDGRPFEMAEAPARMAGGNGPGRARPGGPPGADAPDEDPDAEPEDAEETSTAPVPMADDAGPYRDDAVTVIRGATVVTVTGPTIENGTVVIRDGRIAAVGGADAAVPSGARVVDGTGMYLSPGIIDAHSHIAAGAINEGSVNVSAMVSIEDVVDPDDISIYRALAGGVTSINILHGSANPIGGRNAVIKLRWGADAPGLAFEGAPPGIKFALGENVKRDRNPDRYPGSRMGQQDVIRQAFLDARAYMARWDAYEAARSRGDGDALPPRRDLKLETLAEILRGERLVHAHSYRGDEILQLLRTAEEFGVRIATLQHVLEGYKVADEIAAHGAGASTFSDWWAYKVEAYDAIPYNAALMTERGVLVSINSDSGEEMRHLNQEAAKTMKWGGLSEEEALKLVTLNPAIQLGVQDRVGSIEVGKDADLVLFNAHPLSMDAVVQKTYVDGKLYFDIELDRERQRAIEAEKEALMEKQRGSSRTRVVTDGPQAHQEEAR